MEDVWQRFFAFGDEETDIEGGDGRFLIFHGDIETRDRVCCQAVIPVELDIAQRGEGMLARGKVLRRRAPGRALRSPQDEAGGGS